jgi:hypothetical protein
MTNISNLMQTYAQSELLLDTATLGVRTGYSVATAQGTDLDEIAVAYGLVRQPGESDAAFRTRIVNSLAALKNTKQAILDALAPYTTSAVIYEWSGNWADDKCFFLDWSFMDYTDFIGGGFIAGADYDPFTFEVHIRPIENPINEVQAVTSTTTVNTDYPILRVTGVWDNPNRTGTNYYLPVPPGTFSGNTINLGTAVSILQTSVYITYTSQQILRTIADVILATKPAGTRALIYVERGAYYGSELYGIPFYGP